MPASIYVDSLSPDALRGALEAITAGQTDVVVGALVAEAARGDVGALQAACRAASVPLFGAVFPALLDGGRFIEQGAWLFRVAGTQGLSLVASLPDDPALAAKALARALPSELPGAPPVLLVVFDATRLNLASVVDELYLELADSVRYFGLCAGSGTFQRIPCLFDGERFVADGAIAVLLRGSLALALGHGYVAAADALPATSTRGNRITSIAWRPAFDVYRERTRERYGVEVTRENFYSYAVHFPLGISLASGDTLVRIPVALEADGAIVCVGEVPENALLTLLEAPEADSLHTVDLVARALEERGASSDTLLFYCAGRREHLGRDAARREVASFVRATGRPVFGALSLGEIGAAELNGYPSFHNAVIMAIETGRLDP